MSKKILIVDDDPDFVEATKVLLETSGYAVVSASDGKKGYDKVRSESPDLLLLDVMMSYDSEGFDLARRLRTEGISTRLPVIITTGIRKAKSLPFSFEPDDDWLPVKGVLEKPVPPEKLLTTIAAALQ